MDDGALLIHITDEVAKADGTKSSSDKRAQTGPPSTGTGSRDVIANDERRAGSGSSTKRDRFKRDTSLDEDRSALDANGDVNKKITPALNNRSKFGVKSYLDHFYDLTGSFKDPDLYEDDPDLLLLSRTNRKSSRTRRWCREKCWKIMAVIGIGCLLTGIITTGIGVLYPHHQIQFQIEVSDPLPTTDVDRADNFNGEICRLVGLVMFCVGGLVLAVALLVPSFPSSRCCWVDVDDEDWPASYCTLDYDVDAPLPTRSIKAAVPATKKLTGIQPARATGQTRLINDDAIPY